MTLPAVGHILGVMNMSKRALTQIRLLICSFGALIILTGGVTADDRSAAKPDVAEIAEARALLAKATAGPPKLTAAKTKQIKELIVKLGDQVWKVRRAASSELLKSGPEILPLLTEAVNHKDIEISDRVSVAIKAIQARSEEIANDLNPAIDTLVKIKDKKLIGTLVKLLDHSRVSARYSAEYALRRITGRKFGFNAHNEPPARALAAAKWRKWWKDSEAKFSYDQAGIKARSLAFLITHNKTKTVTAVTLGGKTAWSKVMRDTVYSATAAANGNIIVGSRGTKCVEEYNQQGKSVWAPPGLANASSGVYDVSRLHNGNTLIAGANSGKVFEIDAKGKIVWKATGLNCPTSARRLRNGNTLIADHNAGRAVEIDASSKVVWQKTGLSNPADAVMLPNGNVVIGEKTRVIKVNRGGKILWERKCPVRVTSLCSLPDGTIAIINQTEGAILLGRDGKKIRQLLAPVKGPSGAWNKIRVVPAAVLTNK